MNVVLIDTSSWVAALRRHGDAGVKARVQQYLLDGVAAWCPVVQVELWNGVSSEKERKQLQDMGENIPLLPITEDVWRLACQLGTTCRSAGVVVPATDLIIFACATVYDAAIEHCDGHYDMMKRVAGRMSL
jgi:predicted nucleic acid-binding protein